MASFLLSLDMSSVHNRLECWKWALDFFLFVKLDISFVDLSGLGPVLFKIGLCFLIEPLR